MRQVFSDKASLVLRRMLQYPSREWVVRDFEKELGLGRGWVAKVLSLLRERGYVAGVSRGRAASAVLRNTEELVQEWVRDYDFAFNKMHAYYSPDLGLLSKIKRFFNARFPRTNYALTLHTGANLITHFVRTPNIYLYLDPVDFKKVSLELRKTLDLKELKKGGNVYLIEPYYKKAAFFALQRVQGYPVVSNLQLFLDLYHFPERGLQHAEYLLRRLKEKGDSLA